MNNAPNAPIDDAKLAILTVGELREAYVLLRSLHDAKAARIDSLLAQYFAQTEELEALRGQLSEASRSEAPDAAETVRLEVAPGDDDLEDAWSVLAGRLLGVVDERIAALRVELVAEMDARIAIPDSV